MSLDCSSQSCLDCSDRPSLAILTEKHIVRRRVTGRMNLHLRTRTSDNETISAETAARRALLRQQRVKRSKFAMLVAYSGQGYYGFQRYHLFVPPTNSD